eukprot:TRINITY_DN5566_c0_g1_i1.p1 TRINITY_DN5566_c0_g1~~TRINITY_DN5566_c0_g1_i1.p1  ORF type:complete len:307 (-),score=26.96 TRINITY_DN5566_c0_g1_i1:168-1088(-)
MSPHKRPIAFTFKIFLVLLVIHLTTANYLNLTTNTTQLVFPEKNPSFQLTVEGNLNLAIDFLYIGDGMANPSYGQNQQDEFYCEYPYHPLALINSTSFTVQHGHSKDLRYPYQYANFTGVINTLNSSIHFIVHFRLYETAFNLSRGGSTLHLGDGSMVMYTSITGWIGTLTIVIQASTNDKVFTQVKQHHFTVGPKDDQHDVNEVYFYNDPYALTVVLEDFVTNADRTLDDLTIKTTNLNSKMSSSLDISMCLQAKNNNRTDSATQTVFAVIPFETSSFPWLLILLGFSWCLISLLVSCFICKRAN